MGATLRKLQRDIAFRQLALRPCAARQQHRQARSVDPIEHRCFARFERHNGNTRPRQNLGTGQRVVNRDRLIELRGPWDTRQQAHRFCAVIEDKANSAEQAGGKLPFTYGTVISVEGAESYPLLDNPKNPESQLTRVPVGTDVTLLFSAEGSTTYGSSLWYYVQMSDPEGKNVLWQGYLPAGVVVER